MSGDKASWSMEIMDFAAPTNQEDRADYKEELALDLEINNALKKAEEVANDALTEIEWSTTFPIVDQTDQYGQMAELRDRLNVRDEIDFTDPGVKAAQKELQRMFEETRAQRDEEFKNFVVYGTTKVPYSEDLDIQSSDAMVQQYFIPSTEKVEEITEDGKTYPGLREMMKSSHLK